MLTPTRAISQVWKEFEAEYGDASQHIPDVTEWLSSNWQVRIPKAETQTLRSDTRNPKSEFRNPKLDAFPINPKLHPPTPDPPFPLIHEPRTQNSEPETLRDSEMVNVRTPAYLRTQLVFAGITSLAAPAQTCLYRCRAKREQLKMLKETFHQSQNPNLATTVLSVPYSLDDGVGVHTWRLSWYSKGDPQVARAIQKGIVTWLGPHSRVPLRPKTRNPKPETRNPKSDTGYPKPGILQKC